MSHRAGPLGSQRRRLHVLEVDQAAFGLGHDLLGDDEDVAVLEWRALGRQRVVEDDGEVRAGGDFADAEDGQYGDADGFR